MKKTLILILVLAVQCKTSKVEEISSDVIDLDVMASIHDESSFELGLKFKNSSKRNFLFYAITNQIDPSMENDIYYCREDISVGIKVVYFDKDLNHIFVSEPIHDSSQEEVNLYRSQSMYKVPMADYPSVIVLKGSDSVMIKRTVYVDYFPLERKASFCKVVYYSGNYFKNIVDENIVKNDCNLFNAEVFKGCIKSDFVRIAYD